MTSRLLAGSTAGAVLLFAAAGVVSSANAQAPDLRMIWSVEGESTDYNWDDVNGNPGGFGSLTGNGPDGIRGTDDDGFGTWSVPDNAQTWAGWNYAGTLGGTFQSSETWTLEWNCVFNEAVDGVAAGGGAFVTANIVVTNNDISTQNFTLLMSLPVAPFGNAEERGSIVGTVTDLTLDGATVSAPIADRIYTPRIDGVDEAIGYLMGDGFSESAGPLGSNTVGPQDFGIPNFVPADQPDVDTNIAIFLNFDLSAGDSASFTAIFEVRPIPGAGGLPLLALGLLVGRRRRR